MTIPKGMLFHYDVDIRSSSCQEQEQVKLKGSAKYRCIGTKLNRAIIDTLVKQKGSIFGRAVPAFDGRKNIYLRQKLPEDAYTETVSLDRENKSDAFIVTIKFAAALSWDSIERVYKGASQEDPSPVMQALHCILKHGPTMTYTPIGRSFFQNRVADLGGGKEVWFGFTPSVHLGQWKPFLNLNVTATAFYKKGPLVEFIGHVVANNPDHVRSLNGSPLSLRDIKKVESIIKNSKVRLNHLSYRPSKRVCGLTKEPASHVMFNENGKPTTVAAYFKQQYRGLQYPNLPCIVSGSKDKPAYYPVELCEIPENLHCRKKLEPQETAQMIRQAAIPPDQRFKAIHDKVESLIQDKNSIIDSFGITINPEFMGVSARSLQAPKIVLQGNSVVQPRDGQWGLQDRKLLLPAQINAWGVINFSFRTNDDVLSCFLEIMGKVCVKLGITLPRPSFVRKVAKGATLQDLLQRAAGDVSVKSNVPNWQAFVLIVLDSSPFTIGKYEDIKLICENRLGLKTQCVTGDNVFKVVTKMKHQPFPQLVANICLKINTKCGGVNNSFCDSLCNGSLWGSKLFRTPVIILGADVNHPGVDKMHQPSFAALVGSLDAHPSKYYASVRVQKKAERTNEREIIKDLRDMVKETLRAFYRNTQQKPQKIIFYRDGVSDGQFNEVLSYELNAIRQACTELQQDYKPPITFIVVQKRHSHRLKPKYPKDASRSGNVPPGIVVDTEITHPVNFDFFLCSHAGIQGTSRPSHYCVLHDDNSFSSDDLQELTYSLCHTYARCARSVSIPAPAYYAHWVAFRAHQHAVTSLGDEDASTVSSDFTDVDLQRYIEAVRVSEGLKSSMYFT
uniref:Putative translation initiation factor 2c n=1 Tax=Ornithodoros turicata TaxID=34597 RepID=A0A2R5LN49_9ACAR